MEDEAAEFKNLLKYFDAPTESLVELFESSAKTSAYDGKQDAILSVLASRKNDKYLFYLQIII
jgi:hypothetical protein